MTRDWRWGNLALPEAHLALVVIGVALGIVWPLDLGLDGPWVTIAGTVLILVGVAGMTWATKAAGQLKLADSDHLITTGPYGLSRHPMYAAWTLVYFGLALVLDSGWLLVLAPVLAVWVHWESGREEKRLLDAFGPAYVEYQSKVHRYL